MEIITRAQAKARGLTRYFTGKRCAQGHVAERWIGGKCIMCDREYREGRLEKERERQRKYYEANREKVCEQARKYREANREKDVERKREYREVNREKELERGRKYVAAKRAELRAARVELEALREQGLPEPETVSEAIDRLNRLAAQAANSVDPDRIAGDWRGQQVDSPFRTLLEGDAAQKPAQRTADDSRNDK